MGIKCGVSAVIAKLTMGLYRLHKLRTVTIYVDGELIRYKGMTQDNLTCHEAEEAIADTSYRYLASLKNDIETHLRHRVTEVVVYMDGERVINKTTDRPSFRFDAGVIRRLFGSQCTANGMRMVWLDEGESEIQMYLNRNRENDLNVFVSADSDIIPIMYGHRVTVDGDAKTDWAMQPSNATTTYRRIKDYNRVYVDGEGIRDSCLWIRCGSNVEAYGMDDTVALLGLNPTNFRIMMGLCGSDFTCSVFTETMVQTIVLAYSDESLRCQLELLESQTDIMRIVAGLIYLAISHGCTLKRGDVSILPGDEVALRFALGHATRMLEIYLKYLETGTMTDDIIQPMAIYVLRLCIFMMVDGPIKFTRGDLLKWTNRVTLGKALANFDKNRDRDEPHTLTAMSFATGAKASTKRKNAFMDALIQRKRLVTKK